MDAAEQSVILRKNTKEKGQVRALQILLYSLGFGSDLNWKAYRADGDYGGGTSKAVAAFLQKNGLQGNGDTIIRDVLQLMLERYSLLSAFRSLRQTLNAGKLNGKLSDVGCFLKEKE